MSDARQSWDSVAVFELGARLDEERFAAYLRSLDTALAGARPFAMVVDATSLELEITCAPNRRWQLSRAMAIGQHHRGIAFVTGTMTRERVQALYALQPPGVAYAFFGDLEEALPWARAALDGEAKKSVGQRKTVPMMSAISSERPVRDPAC